MKIYNFDKDEFLQYMYNNFSNYDNPSTRKLLENVVGYGERFVQPSTTVCPDEMFIYLREVVPEITDNELLMFFDKDYMSDKLLMSMGIEPTKDDVQEDNYEIEI